ncbi:MAG: HDOD domain-containing protein [Spirochaetales bacterium]|nr:HDOD domain-containing protein [Spirochaetales bacterium]
MDNLSKYIENLPVIPEVAAKIISSAEDNLDLSFHELEEIIKIDAAITSKILKVANSSLYARQAEIKSLEKAIALLGFKTIKNLVLIISATSAFKSESSSNFFKEFWTNSVLTAFFSKEIALTFSDKRVADDVFLAGLIHKIGQIALYRTNPVVYEKILNSSNLLLISNIDNAELTAFGIDHKILGSNILKEWSFPDIFIDCTREYGSNNILSRFKREIIIITLGDLMSKEVISGEEIFNSNFDKTHWLDYLGITLKGFNEEKQIIINRVENNSSYKEFKSLVL